MGGSKERQIFRLIPYLEKGWNVVNIEHRLAGVTLAPAAVQNCLCALRWIHQNASQYGLDVERIVISGVSSGGWFAVAAAMAPRPEGLDELCPGSEELLVAAIVNWYGNWDLADVLDGPNAKSYAPGWVRGLPDPMAVAKSLSPLPIQGRDGIPVISIHGDADAVVPYSQSVRLHQALKAAGIAQELVTIPGGGHGPFTRSENKMAYEAIWAFLAQQGIGPD
jgi:acetyl esterase/lipase